jgi:hypothetical protein
MEDYSKCRIVTRYPCTGPAEILYNGNLCWGRLNDISSKGCCIETLYPLPIGTEVQLRLTVAGLILDVAAKVAWFVPQSVMAMFFVIVSEQQEDKITKIIEKVKTAGTPSAATQVLPSQAGSENVQVLREANLLAKITRRINERGLLTKQELMDIVNANQ